MDNRYMLCLFSDLAADQQKNKYRVGDIMHAKIRVLGGIDLG